MKWKTNIYLGVFLGAVFTLITMASWGEPPATPPQEKPVQENPDATQSAALPASPYPKTTQSPGVDAALVNSWGRQSSYFISRNFEILTWDEARKVLESGKVKGGKQYHTGWTVIFTEDDRYLLTKPPKLDDPFSFMKEKGITIPNFASE